MPAPDTTATADLVAHILERFHEGHRRDLPPLQALARQAAPDLADHLDAMAEALEWHMFKEEARLFPMMEQGGHAMVGQLIDDLDAEHRAHETALATLEQHMAASALPEALQQGLRHFIAELQAHVQIEDEVLFPRFPWRPDVRVMV